MADQFPDESRFLYNRGNRRLVLWTYCAMVVATVVAVTSPESTLTALVVCPSMCGGVVVAAVAVVLCIRQGDGNAILVAAVIGLLMLVHWWAISLMVSG